MPQRFLTVKETAEMLRFSERHVRYLISQGELPATKVSHSILVPVDELEKILEDSKVTACGVA